MRRLCAGGCKRLVTKGKCDECKRAQQRKRDIERGTAHERGYDAEYLANRAIVLANSTRCWICGLPLTGNPYEDTADHHPIPRGYPGSNKLSNLKPAHKSCNSSRQ